MDELNFCDAPFLDNMDLSFDIGGTQLLDIPTQSLFRGGDENSGRFEGNILKNEDDFMESLMDTIPLNTRKATASAVKTYNAWREWRESKLETFSDQNFPVPELSANMSSDIDFAKWDYWLAR